jgi:hypothetical protein
VVVDDDGHLGREERVEAVLVKSVRVFAASCQDEQIDDVDNTNAKVVAEILVKEGSGLDNLLGHFAATIGRVSRWYSANGEQAGDSQSDTDENDIRVDSLVDGAVLPDRSTGDAVLLSILDRKVDGT